MSLPRTLYVFVDESGNFDFGETGTKHFVMFGRAQLRVVLAAFEHRSIERIVVVFDRALTGRKRGAFEQAIKPILKSTGVPFAVWFQPMSTDLNGQAADYVSWSRYVAAERSEWRPWKALRAAGAVDLDVLAGPPGADRGED